MPPSTSRNDSAVSPVIAVILMVAITVVLAAVVYVWVSGMGEGQNIARSMSLQGQGEGNFTVISASPSLLWEELDFLLDGEPANVTLPSGNVNAGDVFRLTDSGLSGKTLSVVDRNANSVILTLRMR